MDRVLGGHVSVYQGGGELQHAGGARLAAARHGDCTLRPSRVPRRGAAVLSGRHGSCRRGVAAAAAFFGLLPCPTGARLRGAGPEPSPAAAAERAPGHCHAAMAVFLHLRVGSGAPPRPHGGRAHDAPHVPAVPPALLHEPHAAQHPGPRTVPRGFWRLAARSAHEGSTGNAPLALSSSSACLSLVCRSLLPSP